MTALLPETVNKAVATAKLILGIPLEDSSQDAMLAVNVGRANMFIEQYLGYPLEPAIFTETIFLDNYPMRRTILVPFKRLDVDEVIEVSADGQLLTAESGHWHYDKASSALYFHGAYSIAELTISYAAGGEEIHGLLVEALANFTATLAQKVGGAASGVVPVPAGAGPLTSIDIPGVYRASFRAAEGSSGLMASHIPPQVSELLDLFRARGV